MDFMLLVFFVVLWKPLSILLIYVELILKILVSIGAVALRESLMISPYALSSFIFFSFNFELSLTFRMVMLATKFSIFGPSYPSRKNGTVVVNCFLCLLSLSLFLRFFSFYPSTVQLKKHSRLQKVSIIYRILHHIMWICEWLLGCLQLQSMWSTCSTVVLVIVDCTFVNRTCFTLCRSNWPTIRATSVTKFRLCSAVIIES